MNCEYCQSLVHIWFQCPKKPDGWKPARLAKKSVSGRKTDADRPLSRLPPKSASDDKSGRSQTKSGSNRAAEPAATPDKTGRNAGGWEDRLRCDLSSPILPVDTNPGRARATEVIVPSAEGATPSPGAKFDKKAWMKARMPAYMRQYRADVKAGKRVPKKRG